MTKPILGQEVHYYNPEILTRIGWTKGYGGRGAGPYHARVVNDLGSMPTLRVYFPGVQSMEFENVKEGEPLGKGMGYWEWPSAAAKARAAKQENDDARAAAEAAKAAKPAE